MSVVTRFAPSPTGFLHIGGARTALFNWLFARHHGGRFLLRIEDTDRERSTQAAVDAIFDGLSWLGLTWDEEPILQFSRAARHAEVAHQLLDSGNAYYCYCTPEELTRMREEQKAAGLPMRYDGRWRDRDSKDAPAGVKPVIRLKAPREGETVIHDHVQGDVTFANSQLDDMILLRADGTPTYMLSVVVDDHDMNITHVIRGDDHLTNAARQTALYRACGWTVPEFAHIPLIHGPDGAKMSKRHGALGAEAYRDMGILPAAMRNYLLRLGWGHGDDEIISTEQAIAWFDIDAVGKAPSRFDMTRLLNLNAHYLRTSSDDELLALVRPLMEKAMGTALSPTAAERVRRGMEGLKPRAKDLNELAAGARVYAQARPLPFDDKAKAQLAEGRDILAAAQPVLAAVADWTHDALEAAIRDLAEKRGLKLGKVAQPLRAAVTGSTVSPPLFEVMDILGHEECLARLADAIS
jgi:glutamyl-tRNA synthetase